MKNIAIVLFVGLFVFLSCRKDTGLKVAFSSEPFTRSTESALKEATHIINKKDALRIVEPITNKYPDRWVDISNEIIPAGARIEYSIYGVRSKAEGALFFDSPQYDSWLLLIGPDTSINGCQTLLHLFVNIQTGEVSELWIDGMAVIEWDTSRDIFNKSEDSVILNEKPKPSHSRTSPNKWAVILSGGVDMKHNYDRYWYDCKYIYETLTQKLNYPYNHIFCLVSDGTSNGIDRKIGYNTYDSSPLDFDGDGYADIGYSATLSQLSTVFTTLGDLVSEGDEVLIFITDHGSRDNNESQICLWGGEQLSPFNLMCLLLEIDPGATIDIVMGQCYSGGFIPTLYNGSNRTTIVTATGETETSTGTPLGWIWPYDYFLHYWTEAINSINPSVSGSYSNGDGYLSSFEIFKYAKTHTMSDPNASETPHISGPDALSWGHDLVGNSFVPYISGADYVSNNNTSLYSLSGLPSSYSRSWLLSSDLRNISSDNNSITVKGNITSSSQFCSLNNFVSARFSDLGETIDITKKINSVWKPGYYFNQHHIYGGNGVYYIGGDLWPDNYGYNWVCGNVAWQITSQNNNVVYITEGYTLDPVPLMVSFYDPLGEYIFVYDEVQ